MRHLRVSDTTARRERMTEGLFSDTRYLIRRKTLRLFGGEFRVLGPDGRQVLYADMKAFKLREDIRLYTGDDKRTEALTIKARSIIDWAAAYDVTDPATGQKIGALKRKGWKSLIKDEWILMDTDDREIGIIREDSTLLALVRRFLTNLVPQTFHMEMEGAPVARFKQHFNPFVLKLEVDFSADFAKALDRRLGLAAGVLLCAIEGRQS
jgi:hypothetical protein